MPPAPVANWDEIEPGREYGTRDIAALKGVNEDTVLIWIKRGKLTGFLPRISPQSPHRILGATLLKLLGPAQADLVKTETPAERRKRAAADLAAIRGMRRSRTPQPVRR